MSQTQEINSSEPMITNLEDDVDVDELARNTKKRKPKRLTSSVWLDFNRVKIKGVLTAVCKHCEGKLSATSSGGTSHLRNHLRRCMRKPGSGGGQQVLSLKEEGGSTKIETFRFDVERSRTDFAEMTVFHELPFQIASYIGVKKFIHNLQPLFPVKGPKTLRADCIKVYDREKERMYDVLENVKGRVSITSDMWTASTQNKGYMALTAHYLDDDWILKKRVLNFVHVEVPHTAENLAGAIMTCLMEWNIDRKLFSLSLDNCSTNDAMARIVCRRLDENDALICNGEFFHARCSAHVLNLVVQEGWNALLVGSKKGEPNVIDKVRESVKYWTVTPKRESLFNDVVKQCHITYRKSLILDSQTRWNSTHEMLMIALEYKEAFKRLRARDKGYTIDISSSEWEMVKCVADCLKIFHDVSDVFSGTKYPTANIFFHEMCKVNLAISRWEVSTNQFVKKMASAMRIKFDQYWVTSQSSLALASILDPQFKFRLLDYYFPLFYGGESSEKIKEMKASFERIYNEYAADLPSNHTNEEGSTGVYAEGVGLSEFDQFIQQTSSTIVTKRDLDYYLEEPVLPRGKDFDILSWWKVNEGKYPILAKMARDVLAIPASTVASESVFSTGGRVLDKYRSSMGSDTAQGLICGQDWLRDSFKGWETKMNTLGELLAQMSTKEQDIGDDGVDGYSD